MEQLLHAFGIDIKLISVQILNFAILAGLLTYFLYKPVLKILEDREEKINQGIKDAEEAAEARKNALIEKQAVLSEAQQEAGEIDSRARAYAKEKEAEIVVAAQNKASDVIRDAEVKSELLKKQALKESEAEIARVAILAAKKILEEKTL